MNHCGEPGREQSFPLIIITPRLPKFHVYVIYKVYEGEGGGSGESKEGGGAPVAVRRRHVAGFMTTYRFTNPVRKERPVTRSICQALILPPFQRMGLGGRLLEVRC